MVPGRAAEVAGVEVDGVVGADVVGALEVTAEALDEVAAWEPDGVTGTVELGAAAEDVAAAGFEPCADTAMLKTRAAAAPMAATTATEDTTRAVDMLRV